MESNTLLAFLKKASEDEGLRKDLVALAGRYGVQLGSDELSEAALDQVSGGLGGSTGGPRGPGPVGNILNAQSLRTDFDYKPSVGNVAKLCDGSV